MKYYLWLALMFIILSSPIWAVSYTVENVVWTNATGVTVSGNSLTATVSGWQAGAFSVQSIDPNRNGYVEMVIQETGAPRMFGLSDIDVNACYDTIDYAIYAYWGTELLVYESGNYRGVIGAYNTGDILRVARENSYVKYYRNGALLYTSTITTNVRLFADSSLYSPGYTIYNATIAQEVIPEPCSLMLLLIGFALPGIKRCFMAFQKFTI